MKSRTPSEQELKAFVVNKMSVLSEADQQWAKGYLRQIAPLGVLAVAHVMQTLRNIYNRDDRDLLAQGAVKHVLQEAVEEAGRGPSLAQITRQGIERFEREQASLEAWEDYEAEQDGGDD